MAPQRQWPWRWVDWGVVMGFPLAALDGCRVSVPLAYYPRLCRRWLTLEIDGAANSNDELK